MTADTQRAHLKRFGSSTFEGVTASDREATPNAGSMAHRPAGATAPGSDPSLRESS